MPDAAMTDESRYKCEYYVLCTLTVCNTMYSIRVAAVHTVLRPLWETQDNCWTNKYLHRLCLYSKTWTKNCLCYSSSPGYGALTNAFYTMRRRAIVQKWYNKSTAAIRFSLMTMLDVKLDNWQIDTTNICAPNEDNPNLFWVNPYGNLLLIKCYSWRSLQF